MKKFSLTFLGDIEIRKYGIYLGNVGLEEAIQKALLSESDTDKENGKRYLARVNLTIDPVEDAGLNVVVEEA